MQRFWDALYESTLTQGALAMLFGTTTCVMWLQGKTVPSELIGLLMLIIGFYFRSKAGSDVRKNMIADQKRNGSGVQS